MLIVSCFSVPKSNEEGIGNRELANKVGAGTGNGEQSVVTELVEVSREQGTGNGEQGIGNREQSAVTELVEVSQPEAIPEEPVLAEAVAEEENPPAEYVEAFALNESQEIAQEPEEQPAEIVMENLRPVEASPLELALPVEPSSPTGTSPSVPPPALPEQRTAQTVPPDFSPPDLPVRESWRQPTAPAVSPPPQTSPKSDPLEAPAIVQETPPVVNNQPEERILQPDYPITFSRVARVTVGQLVEIPFRGRDWVFIGEVGARRGIAYDSRKLDPEGESFIFRVEASGIYALKFYRQDFAQDLILNDHVQIIAGGAPETTGLGWFNPPTDRSRVVAEPRWPNLLEPSQRIDSYAEQQLSRPIEEPGAQPPVTTVQPSAAAQPQATAQPPAATQPTARPPATVQPAAPPARVAQASPTQPQSSSVPQETTAPKETQPAPVAEISPDSILKQARDEFNAGRIASAITLLDQFCKSFPSGSDEAWWLYGQCFEANSPNRNMLSALDYYRRLVREYPQSSRLSDARRRIAYLERYYINIQ